MDETKLLYSRLDDLTEQSYDGQFVCLGFLNEVEASAASAYLKNRHIDHKLFGGYEAATRFFVAVSSYGEDDFDTSLFPIKTLVIKARKEAVLSHRDYLGSLMGLGIKRECIGDIALTDEHTAVVFVRDDISDYLKNELSQVGREAVKVTEFSGSTDSLCSKSEEISIIVSSMRIDNVVSALANVSRGKAQELIEADMVFVNYCIPSKTSQTVCFDDTLSIRGYGKYRVLEQTNTTKRNRLVIKLLHYI